MTARRTTSAAIERLVARTFEALSTPGSEMAEFFGTVDIAISGSGRGELWSGPDAATAAAMAVASRGHRWTPVQITVWERGEVAWAQILSTVHVARDGVEEDVPYTTTAVFGHDARGWHWLHWGGSEPQDSPRV